jgi:hypothetical protein
LGTNLSEVIAMIRNETQAVLLDDVRREAETAESMFWTYKGDEMYLEVTYEDGIDSYIWSSTDARYVHPVGYSQDALHSA